MHKKEKVVVPCDSCPGGSCLVRQLSCVTVVREAVVLCDSCPGDSCTVWQLSWWQFSSVAVVVDANNCPGLRLS